ncbi:MAG TPA: hypothetical protein VF032_09850 [Thermoleophilaceae bacterium]
MGLLDDAIREHLELKRRHGASDEEIAQEEAEALGPARREFPQPATAEEQSAELQSAEEPEPLPDEPAPMGLEPELEPEPETEAMREPEPEPPTSDPPASDRPDPDPPTSDLGPPASSDDDVLEETPEFLQDAPEHDRLWFEQKPPRDFDFE